MTAAELAKGNLRDEAGKSKLLKTRREVERGWHAVGEILVGEGRRELAAHVREYVGRFPVPRTDREQIADTLLQRLPQRSAKEHTSR
jgi:hypothetical protein